jgi:hypothetical protein
MRLMPRKGQMEEIMANILESEDARIGLGKGEFEVAVYAPWLE